MSANPEVLPLGREGWTPDGKSDPLAERRGGLIGAPLSRLDGALKVTGTARFTAEASFDSSMGALTYAALAYGTIPKGRLANLDVTAAEAAPGVVLVMTHRNAPRLNPPPGFGSGEKAGAGDSLPVMQDDRVYWNGQPVALVLADTQEQADHACSLIRVTYEAEPAVTGFDDAKARGTEVGTFFGNPLSLAVGDPEAALAAAPHQVDVTYTTPRHNHNAIELHAVTLAWDGDELFVHDASQGVRRTAWTLAEVFGIHEDQVHVSCPYLGGGFGGKGLWQHQVLAAAASRLARRPVRLMLSRKGVYRLVGGRAATEQRVAIGAQADGRFDALIHTGTVAKGRFAALPEPFVTGTMGMYQSGSLKIELRTANLDMLTNTFMRAPGEAVGSFALESAIDELACEMGIDPIELRLANEPEADPVTGKPFSSRHLAQAYRAGAERFGWAQRDATPGTRRDGEWLVGLGTAATSFPYVRMPGGAARITITRDGRARVDIAAHEMGMGTATAQTQVA
ncbi:MAG TPA: molybdopterin cofactor-binding domain-containing protein, partial [Trebonia sp.]|nr:molybdopterin cofactor-binding domain-containing protein [Trebonia sp.]